MHQKRLGTTGLKIGWLLHMVIDSMGLCNGYLVLRYVHYGTFRCFGIFRKLSQHFNLNLPETV